MALSPGTTRLVVHADARLEAELRYLSGQRMVFFAGLPGTGKSLLVHQFAHLSAAAGRSVHLLQWDVARPVFEASPLGRRYPLADGVTHPIIRKAAGQWVRDALVRWDTRHPAPGHLLVGETPFVGNRFVELAHRLDDPAEPLLSAPSCRFVIPLPSAAVRSFLEAQRERRAANPLHPREREDAPPQVLRNLWREIDEAARQLGIAPRSSGPAPQEPRPYDPVTYRKVYELVLRHRYAEIVRLDTILPTERLSVYDFAVRLAELVPTEEEAEHFVTDAERRYAGAATLADEITRWWDV